MVRQTLEDGSDSGRSKLLTHCMRRITSKLAPYAFPEAFRLAAFALARSSSWPRYISRHARPPPSTAPFTLSKSEVEHGRSDTERPDMRQSRWAVRGVTIKLTPTYLSQPRPHS